MPVFVEIAEPHVLAREGAIDEGDLALHTRHTTAIVVERFDPDGLEIATGG
jgi:hypothetical protein